MANNIAFSPMGNTSVLTCGATSNSTVVTANSPSNQFMCVNTGTVPAFLVASTANVTAVVPTTGNTTSSWCLGAGATKVVTVNQSSQTANVTFSGITATGTANVYITAGEGL